MAAVLASSILGGLVGALIGLVIALLGQSREDARMRLSEEWRQRNLKQERLRDEFATALNLVYMIDTMTAVGHWVTPAIARTDPSYQKRLSDLDDAYKQGRAADIRLRLDGAKATVDALDVVATEHLKFRRALDVLGDKDQPRSPALKQLDTSHKAISAVAADLHEKLAAELEALTPPGPPPLSSGLSSWIRETLAWVQR